MKSTIAILAIFLSFDLMAGDFFSKHDEPKTGFVVGGGGEDPASESQNVLTNRIEILKFTPRFSYLDSGDIHCVVDFFIQYFQTSSNFCDYAFARNIENHKLEQLKIHFLDADEYEILSIPCINNGHDMIWDMQGTRIVQIHCSFIMTYGRCDYLNGNVLKMSMSDERGFLLGENGRKIVYDLTRNDIDNLTTKILSRIKRKK